ncbi:adenylosuccinate synthetase [Candidatus Woesearchaeota archaeon]|nr:adenylosuccinate synthetase [Candidatus Woesearchaeota archaeon]
MLDIVVGAQFGDEGKGRIVHNLALLDSYFAGIRAQGANNAGHTVMHEGVLYKLHLIPSAVLAGKQGFLGRGMALNLDVLVNEIEGLREKGIDPQLVIDPRAHVIMPWHIQLDGVNEKANGNSAAGSTGRGVAPVYASKHERTGIRVADFFGDSDRVMSMASLYAGRVASVCPGKEKEELLEEYLTATLRTIRRASFLLPSLKDVSVTVDTLLRQNKDLVGECAQSEMIDVDSPYYPRGTSSGTGAPGFLNGIGLMPVGQMRHIIGAAKGYVTRVGNGAFITEIQGDFAETLRQKGGEFGTTTGRPRRVGWFDVPMVKYAARTSGFTGLAITKLDILGGMDEIPVAIHYDEGDVIPCLNYDNVTPQYRMMKGWPEMTEDLYRLQFENGIGRIPHPGLRAYLEMIQDEIQVPISQVCFGQSSSAYISYI